MTYTQNYAYISHNSSYTIHIKHTFSKSIRNFDLNKYSPFWSHNIHKFDQQVSTILVNRYPQFWNTSINKSDQQIFTILNTTYSYFWQEYPQFWSTNILKFDQHLYTIWPNFDTGGAEVWSKFGRHFDQTSTLGVSKFGRSLASKFGRHLIEHLDCTMWFTHISIKLRPNFDVGGVGIWSEFGRRFYQTSPKLRHWCQSLGSFYQI